MNRLFYLFVAIGLSSQLFAQKLPDIQSTGLLAPSNIRIDGKINEWNFFSAENKRTELLYSLANDEKNLYLVIKAANNIAVNKIMMGGISFAINTEGKKREKDAVIVTYPLIVRATRNAGGVNRQQGGGQGLGQGRNQQDQKQRDSLAIIQRKNQLATVKEIKISGIKSIADSLVSIYNEYGIKAVASIDDKGTFVYELAIPLNLLELPVSQEFAYQIKVNGMSGFAGGNRMMGGGQGAGAARPAGGGGGRPGGGGAGGFNGAGGNFNGGQDLMTPTDFWGKYSLIKK